jgi:adenylate kinase
MRAAAVAATELLRCPKTNLSLIGPPGSGKGSYGKHLAHWLGVPLVIASDVLRQLRPDCIAPTAHSGQLVDDETVSDALMEYLLSSFHHHHHHTPPPPPRCFQEETDTDGDSGGNGGGGGGGYILDGFPRTMAQVRHMQDTWPVALQVQAAICLTVPDSVCVTKLLGRRHCPTCKGSFNINGVSWGEWNMPPSLPDFGNHCPNYHTTTATTPANGNGNVVVQDAGVMVCHPDTDWHVRPDDTPSIIQERLKVHHGHMDPIVEHFQRQNRLFSFSPYKGFDDVPRLQQSLDDWLKERNGRSMQSDLGE